IASDAPIAPVVGVRRQALTLRRQVHDRFAEALAVGVSAAVLLERRTEFPRVHDQVKAMALLVVGARGALARDALDEYRDLVRHVRLVIAEAPLSRVVAVELRHAAFGYIEAEQPQEVVGERRVVALDLVDREDEQITRGQLSSGNEL